MGEFEGGDEAELLVQAAEVAGQVEDDILFLEDLARSEHSIAKPLSVIYRIFQHSSNIGYSLISG